MEKDVTLGDICRVPDIEHILQHYTRHIPTAECGCRRNACSISKAESVWSNNACSIPAVSDFSEYKQTDISDVASAIHIEAFFLSSVRVKQLFEEHIYTVYNTIKCMFYNKNFIIILEVI